MMREVDGYDSLNVPTTSFPTIPISSGTTASDSFHQASTMDELLDELHPILIISDPKECNCNLSIFIKLAVDYLKARTETYHLCSVLALELLNLNLFIKNHQLCLGKVLGLLSILSQSIAGDCIEDTLTLKKILLVILLLLFKLSTEETGPLPLSQAIDRQEILDSLRDFRFVEITAQFISGLLNQPLESHASYVMLNFSCNIFFQYLYHVILFSDTEFTSLASSDLIPKLIDQLLSSDNFNNYDLAGQDFEDVDNLIAYEEFKLLLLLNEQFMMRSIYSKNIVNTVIDGLLATRENTVNGICGFVNLLVYHMNREESHIIRIQMLKFLYLLVTSPASSKQPYLNDLKIIVDIVIRELNDLDYSSERLSQENRLLALTYLKILYPLLTLTQLNDITPKYKAQQIAEVLSNVIINCDESSPSRTQNDLETESTTKALLKSAIKCLSVSWLKPPRKQRLKEILNTSSDSLASTSSLTTKINNLLLESPEALSSTDSFSITRISSVKASSINDYNKTMSTHNFSMEDGEPINIFEANNLNMFRVSPYSRQSFHSGQMPSSLTLNNSGPFLSSQKSSSPTQTSELPSFPREFLLSKRLPPLPEGIVQGRQKISTPILLQEKAKLKKAPPPPPPPSRRKR